MLRRDARHDAHTISRRNSRYPHKYLLWRQTLIIPQICSLPQTTATLVTTATLATPTLPILGFPTPELPIPDLPTPALPSSPVLSDTPLVPGCECEEMFCIQSYPESCHCAYNIKKTCWAKCGGPSPGLNTCPAVGSNPFDGPVKRAAQAEVKVPAVKPTVSILPIAVVTEVATSVVVAASAPTSIPTVVAPLASAKVSPIKKCKCEEVMCIQSFPAGCFCANAGKRACWKKCGGPKPAFQVCTSISLVITKNPQLTTTELHNPPKPPNPLLRTHKSTNLRRRPRRRKPLPQRLHLHQRPVQAGLWHRVRRHGYLRKGEVMRRVCRVQV